MDASLATANPTTQAPAEEVINHLRSTVGRLEYVVDDMTSRLHPVMTPEQPTPGEAMAQPVAPRSESLVVTDLREVERQVDRLADRLGALVKRLEV